MAGGQNVNKHTHRVGAKQDSGREKEEPMGGYGFIVFSGECTIGQKLESTIRATCARQTCTYAFLMLPVCIFALSRG